MAPMRRPRMWRSWLSRSWSMRWPCSRIWPETMRPGGSSKPVMAAPGDLAGGEAAGRRQQADDGRAGERLAGAGLPHHAQNLAGCDGKADVIERAQAAAPAGEFD